MDQQLPLRLSSDPPLFNWDDFRPKNTSSKPSRPLSQEFENSDITSLLSARSYPLPESYKSQHAPSRAPSPSPGDFALGLGPNFTRTNTDQTPLSQLTTLRPQKRQRHGPRKAISAKGRGGPRDVDDSKENTEERRRIQTRMAQRAYRSRQQASVDGLKSRILQLETSMEKMSSAMLSFSEQLVQSGVLRSHPALTANLRDTMKTFLTMASGASFDDKTRVLVDSDKTIDSSPVSQQPTNKRSSPNIPLDLPLGGTGLYHPNRVVLPYTVNSPNLSIIEVSEFIERLLLAGLYQGYLALYNPSIGMDLLQRHFGFIFSMMSRERLTAYFKAELHAQVSQEPLDGWDEVPFFRLGGRRNPLSRREHRILSLSEMGHRGGPLLEGDWFDLQELEGYIRDENVLLIVSAGEPTKCSNVQTNINVSRFISALISRGVCLGRTPGFQRDHVVEALNFAKVV
ncbi:hypothetical protein N7513_006078 [Penicillium frequentans]|nr:hypothetical protein N7513_006078 [Penicillium glabrum]